MANEPPPDDERPDEPTDEHPENRPDDSGPDDNGPDGSGLDDNGLDDSDSERLPRGDSSDDSTDDGTTGGESPAPGDRHPPIGSGSTDRWPFADQPGSTDSEDESWLSSLLRILDSLDRTASASGSGQPGGRFGLEYDVSIGSGLEPTDSDSSRRSPDRSTRISRDSASGRDTFENRPSRTRRRRSSLSTHRVATRTYDDELLVIADVSSVAPETVTVGFDGSDDDVTLVVGVGDRELERVDVPWDRSSVEADARIKNGVLTVTVSRDHLDGPEDTASGGPGHSDDFGGDGRE